MKHRKLLSLLSAALLGITATAFTPEALEPICIVAEAAQIKTPEGLILNQSGSTLYVAGYNGSNMNVKVPSEYEGMPITAVAANAFKEKKIKTIQLPDSITKIGKYAFYGCQQLTEIVIPKKVTKLEARTFYNCKKLKNAEIKGAAKIEEYVFCDCKSLENITMNPGCTRAVSFSGKNDGLRTSLGVFENCTSLKKINGNTVVKKNASGKPYLIGDQDVRDIIGKFVTRSENVYFVKNYCNSLCDYIIKTELVAGMSDAIHARQLHNWLVRNCAYTTKGTRYGEEKDLFAPEFSSKSAMFLNYGLYGVGEGVCVAYAYAYEQLLHTAHIDSYVLSNADKRIKSDDHAWTLAKLDGKWYQIDVTTDDVQSCYKYFMKTNSQMEKLDKTFTYKNVGVHVSVYQTTNDDLDAGVAALNQAIYSYQDANEDGILDGDWNLDGVKNNADTAFKKRLIQAQGSASAVQDSQMNKYVAMLHRIRMSPEKYLQSEGY